MGACREGYDLTREFGRKHFYRALRGGNFPRLMWLDTFGRVLCWLAGEHAIKQDFDGGNVETSCQRCCHWLKQGPGRSWVEKR